MPRLWLLEFLQVHHLTKRSQLGHDELDNLVTSLQQCHRSGHGRHGHSFALEKSGPDFFAAVFSYSDTSSGYERYAR